jgi:hypothetical protein
MLCISTRRIGEAAHDQGTGHVSAMRNRGFGRKAMQARIGSERVLTHAREIRPSDAIRSPGVSLSLMMDVRHV